MSVFPLEEKHLLDSKVMILHLSHNNCLLSIPGICKVENESIEFNLIETNFTEFVNDFDYTLSRIITDGPFLGTFEIQLTLVSQNKGQLWFNYKSSMFYKQKFEGNLLTELVRIIPSIEQDIHIINEKIAQDALNENNTASLFVHSSSKLWEHRINFTLDSDGKLIFSLLENSNLGRFVTYEKRATMSIDDSRYGEIQYKGILNFSDNHYIFTPLEMQFGTKSKFETYKFERNAIPLIYDITQYSYNKIKFYFQLFRVHFLFLSLIPIITVSALMQSKHTDIDIKLLILQLVIISTIQISSNLLNDYFDDKSNSDEYVMLSSSFTSGTKFIQLGLIDSLWVLVASLVLLFTGIFLGLYLVFVTHDPVLLLFGVLGVVIAIFYSVPPVKLAYRWYGDVLFSIALSGVLIEGTLYLQSGVSFTIEYVLLSIILALNVNLILLSGNIKSSVGETAANKSSLVTKFGITGSYNLVFIQILFSMLLFNVLIFLIEGSNFLFSINVVYILLLPDIRRFLSKQATDFQKSELFSRLFGVYILQFATFCSILVNF